MFSGISTTNKNLYDYKYFGGTGKQFVSAIAGDIKANHAGQPIVIYGYSRGGDMALQLSRALGAMDIYVSLLNLPYMQYSWRGLAKIRLEEVKKSRQLFGKH